MEHFVPGSSEGRGLARGSRVNMTLDWPSGHEGWWARVEGQKFMSNLQFYLNIFKKIISENNQSYILGTFWGEHPVWIFRLSWLLILYSLCTKKSIRFQSMGINCRITPFG